MEIVTIKDSSCEFFQKIKNKWQANWWNRSGIKENYYYFDWHLLSIILNLWEWFNKERTVDGIKGDRENCKFKEFYR